MLALVHGNDVVKKWGMENLVILHVVSSGLHENRQDHSDEAMMANFASSYIEENAGSICQKIATIGNCVWTAFHLSISTLSPWMVRVWIDAPIPLGTKSLLVNSHSLSPKCESSLVVLYKKIHWILYKGFYPQPYLDDDEYESDLDRTSDITCSLVDEIPDVDVNVIDNDGTPLLICMLQCGALSTVIRLLQKVPDIDVNIRCKYHGFTFLMYLTFELEGLGLANPRTVLDVMRTLTERAKLDVNATNDLGQTALHVATKNSDIAGESIVEMIDILSSTTQLDVNVRDMDGETVLLWSLKKRKIAPALKLLDIPGIDIHAMNKDGLNAPLLVVKSMAYDNDSDEIRGVARKMLSKLGI
jgi:ankyrin repeat protein